MCARLTRGDFIDRCRKAHGDKYDYSGVEYKNNKTKVTISCPVHGDFKKLPSDHLKGQGCPRCGNSRKGSYRKMSKCDFISRAVDIHGDRYDYSDVEWESSTKKVKLLCKIHGEFYQTPKSHLGGCGCPACGKALQHESQKMSEDEYLSQVVCLHGDTYGYDDLKYTGSTGVVRIECPNHGYFNTVADYHRRGSGCPICSMRISSEEDRIFKTLKTYFPDMVQSDRSLLAGQELDMYSKNSKLAIEFNGVYWHSDRYKNKMYHKNKYRMCKKQGVHLIQITDIDWQNKKDVLLKMILHAGGASSARKVNARQCSVVRLKNKDCEEIYTLNHPQGPSSNSVNYGLLTADGELVAAMSFGFGKTSRGTGSSSAAWELSRFSSTCTVRGGASRLLSRFIRDHNPKVIRSFSMNDWFSGGLYEKLGFVGEEIPVDYRVYHPKLGILPKSKWQRREIPKRLIEIGHDGNFDPTTDRRTEKQIEDEVGALRIWDSGKIRWELVL